MTRRKPGKGSRDRFRGETPEQIAAHVEIDQRYERKKRGAPSSPYCRLAAFRLRDLAKLFRARFGNRLPDNAEGRLCLRVAGQHLLHRFLHRGSEASIMDYTRQWAPWCDDPVALARQVAALPELWTADRLGEVLELDMAERQALGITTIGAWDVSEADRIERRRERKRQRERDRRTARRTGRPRGRPRKNACPARDDGAGQNACPARDKNACPAREAENVCPAREKMRAQQSLLLLGTHFVATEAAASTCRDKAGRGGSAPAVSPPGADPKDAGYDPVAERHRQALKDLLSNYSPIADINAARRAFRAAVSERGLTMVLALIDALREECGDGDLPELCEVLAHIRRGRTDVH